MKKFWSIIKTLTPSKHASSAPVVLEDEKTGNKINRPDLIAKKFNQYFCSVGKKLAAKFDLASSYDYQYFLTKRILSSMYFSSTTECEVFDAIKQLNPSKSSGFERISPKFIRVTADILAPLLEKLLNACFECGFFPNTLKIAKVIPVFKTGDKIKLTNYKPISLLSCFSKILEKSVYHKMIKFLNKNSVFSPYQFGFRPGCSTVHATIDIIANCNDT